MEMERGIDPDTLLDYVELQIFPIQSRYEAYVRSNNKAQKVASGTLEQLLLHSPRVKDLSKGSNTNFKILPPDNPIDADWFTTTTLTRFLHIIGSQDIVSIGNEISQLEETRKFQLSLSVKGEVDITSSINSKNELLRAVDLRLTALKDELASAFDQVTGQRCSTKDISDLENFSHHFGAKDIRDSLQKFVEMNLFPSPQASKTTTITTTTTTTFNKNDKNTPTPDNENSSVSSDDINNNQPSIERSRTVTRSITPRRSASPMRRIQIGRCGSHRAAALTIKSLNYFPPREKLGFQKDHSNSSDEEEEEEGPTKKNVLRLSVQDKISLFESKQKGETVNFVKSKTLLNTKKGVLRRWSSGMGETAATTTNNNDNTETAPENVVPKIETVEKITKVDDFDPEREEKKVDSIEWSQQKEVELNQLFTEMESKPVKPRKLTDDDVSKSEKVEQRGGFYDDYKQKRDEKLIKKETTGKRVEKEAQFKVMKRFIDENKPQKSQRNSIPLTNSRKESPKPILKKPNALPTTRKSWPATQPPKAKEASPSRTIRKPQSTSSSTKAEKSKSKSTPPPPVVAASKNLEKPIKEKKQPTITKVTKDTKTVKSTKPKVKVNTPESDSKPSFINKVTKKNNSVVPVPLESKPFLRKGSGIKTKVPEASRSSETLVQSEENEVVMVTTDVIESLDSEPHVVKFEELETVTPERVEMSEMLEQESVIPPTAWVESESEPEPESELEVEEMIPIPVPTLSPVKVVKPDVGIGVGNGIGITSPRIRHSLSQMLLEDNNEDGDSNNNGEWGNAENPPSILYQKEPPKGFKRLLNTTKGRRSFFSLSTFRGSKTNESKFP